MLNTWCLWQEKANTETNLELDFNTLQWARTEPVEESFQSQQGCDWFRAGCCSSPRREAHGFWRRRRLELNKELLGLLSISTAFPPSIPDLKWEWSSWEFLLPGRGFIRPKSVSRGGDIRTIASSIRLPWRRFHRKGMLRRFCTDNWINFFLLAKLPCYGHLEQNELAKAG